MTTPSKIEARITNLIRERAGLRVRLEEISRELMESYHALRRVVRAKSSPSPCRKTPRQLRRETDNAEILRRMNL